MPSTTTVRGYPFPVDSDPIDVAGDIENLANAIDVDVIAKFSSIAERDTKWPSPPAGSRCIIPFTSLTGTRRLDFLYDSGAWRPKGIVVQGWMTGRFQQNVDITPQLVNYNAQSININNAYSASGIWTIPFTGLVAVTAGLTLMVGTTEGQANQIGDYIAALNVDYPPATTGRWGLNAINARFAQVTLQGRTVFDAVAGQTVRVTLGHAGTPGGSIKTIAGGADNNAGLLIEYI